MKTRRLKQAGYDILTDLLGYGEHTDLGRVLPAEDNAHEAVLRAIRQRGEDLWYRPSRNGVDILGRLIRLEEPELEALRLVTPRAMAAVEWTGPCHATGEERSAVQLLQEDEYRRLRQEVPGALVTDLIAADDRERTGQRGESVEEAAGRLVQALR